MKLIIDAGHGMGNAKAGRFDSGATGAGVTEASVTLTWANTLAYYCKLRRIPFHMIREGNEDSNPVGSRAGEGMAEGGTHYLAIHCDAAGPTASGVSTFYRDAGDLAWANAVQEATVKATGLHGRGVLSEHETHVGRLAIMAFKPPCALVEVGFITNEKDRKVLLSRETRMAFANNILDALQELG